MQNELYEKSFTPKVENIRENEYTNSKGETKKQCFIPVHPEKGIALVMPYDKETLCEKFKNEMYPENLNIGIKKDYTFTLAIRNPKNGKTEFKKVDGTELRKHIDYYININLKDAYINPLKNAEGRTQVAKNGISFIVPDNWIKQSQFNDSKYLSVKHNAKIEISTALPSQEGQNTEYKNQKVSWAYVGKVFEKHVKERTSLDNQVSNAENKKENQTDKDSKTKDNELER